METAGAAKAAEAAAEAAAAEEEGHDELGLGEYPPPEPGEANDTEELAVMFAEMREAVS